MYSACFFCDDIEIANKVNKVWRFWKIQSSIKFTEFFYPIMKISSTKELIS